MDNRKYDKEGAWTINKINLLKKTIIVITLILLLFTLVSCSGNVDTSSANSVNSTTDNGEMLIKLLLTRTSEEAYIFELYSNKTLVVYTGSGYNFDLSSEIVGFTEVNKKESKALPEDKFSEITDLCNSIKPFEPSDKLIFDYWEVTLIVNSKKYNFTYGSTVDESLDNLVTQFIENSPINIVDEMGNQVKPVKIY